MPGTFVRPMTYNRHFAINIGTAGSPIWAEFCKGVTSRGNDYAEDTEDYYDMCGRGIAETVVSGQTITRNFSGWRVFGDAAQDFLFFDRIYDFANREVQFLSWYDDMPAELVTAHGNGEQGNATLTISDDGSGDANVRENVEWGLAINGQPVRGNVTVTPPSTEGDLPTYTFAPLSA